MNSELTRQSNLSQANAPLDFAPPSQDKNMNSQMSEPEDTKSNSDQEVESLKKELASTRHELAVLRTKGKYVARELDMFRQRRAIVWSDRFRNTFDSWNLMNRGFQRLKDDTILFSTKLAGNRLQASTNLQRVPYVSYELNLKRANLCAVYLAPIVEIPLDQGEICLQILGAHKELLIECSVPVSEISDERPTQFNFPAIPQSDSEILTMKLFVQGVHAPLRIFELRKYELGGFGRLITTAFAGFEFSEV